MSGRESRAPAIVFGLSPAGLYIVRELAADGVPVYGISDAKESGAYSKYLRSTGGFIKASNADALVEQVARIAERHNAAPVLFPASDRYIEWIAAHYDTLSPIARFSCVYRPDRFEVLLDKHRFYGLCEQLGVSYPLRFQLADYRQGKVENPVTYPVLIKPARLHEVNDIMAGRKVFVCENEAQLNQKAAELPAGRGGWLVQEIVEGPATSIFCMGGVRGADGEIHAAVSGRKLRQFPSGYGTASALLTEEVPPELWQATESLLDEIGLDGLFEIEFKQDSKDGRWKVFEINARSALWFGVAEKCSRPLAAAAYAHHTSRPLPGEAGPQTDGVLWRSGLKDLLGRLFFSERPSRDVRARLPARQTSAWAVWDLHDPLPAIAELLGYAGKLLRRMVKR